MVTQISECLSEARESDAQFAACVMNSGMFALSDAPVGGTSSGSLGVVARMKVGSATAGTCSFLCTGIKTTASCCEAQARVLQCKTPVNASKCQIQLEEILGDSLDCGFGSSNLTLVIVVGVMVLVFFSFFLYSKCYRPQKSAILRVAETAGAGGVGATLAQHQQQPPSPGCMAQLAEWWRQVLNLVWKNLILRRRKPFKLLVEQCLPLILVGGLLIIADLDSIFHPNSKRAQNLSVPQQGQVPAEPIICVNVLDPSPAELGSPTSTMTSFYTSGQTVVGMYLLLSYIRFVSSTSTTMVLEKEIKIREVMKIMGLSDIAILASWLITSMVLSTPLSILIALELKYGKVFPNASLSELVFLFWSLSMSIVGFAYFLTPFFNKSRTASIASVLLWILLFFPFYSVQPEPNTVKYLAALSPPTAFALAVDSLLRHAQFGTGFAYVTAMVKAPITVPTATNMSWFLLFDTVLLCFLGWYCQQVVPQEFGIAKPWYFLFDKHYWRGLKRSNDRNLKNQCSSSVASNWTTAGRGLHATPIADQDDACDSPVNSPPLSPQAPFVMRQLSSDMWSDHSTLTAANTHMQFAMNPWDFDKHHDTVEPVNATLLQQEHDGTCLQIRDLSKLFKTDDDGERLAVNHLNLTMYSGQITALLGHNGAGKTTTISILTGLIPPTSGNAMLYGRSIRGEMDELRQIMGVCPQHDVLFDDLTVQEHLSFFATMKNVLAADMEEQVTKMIQEVGLTEKRHVLARNLSGGQKRKLSVAMAFIGDSRLVFLDEPTSGMDPYSRRFTWNLLQRNREERVIVLTTHFMDEADILGDRIAIMSDGELCCAGSSLFLKNRYGTGYNLTLLKKSVANGNGNGNAVGHKFDMEECLDFVRQFVPEATCLSHFGSEVVLQLPTSSSLRFADLLESLDMQLERLGVAQYGISVTTLEEVFLKIARDREDLARKQVADSRHRNTSGETAATTLSNGGTPSAALAGVQMAGPEMTISVPGFGVQVGALLTKRFRITKRDKKSLVTFICIPILFLLMLVLVPEIHVSNFLPNHASTVPSPTDKCPKLPYGITAEDIKAVGQDECSNGQYDYCTLGVLECDAKVCCDATNRASPYFQCAKCSRPKDSSTATGCYNYKCLKKRDAKLQIMINAFLVSIIIVLAFCFLPASIIAFVVREKNPLQNAKFLQLICGATKAAYWISNWLHDALISLLPFAVALIILPLTHPTLSSTAELLALAMVLLSHLAAVIPLAYWFSFRFERHAVAQTSLLVFALCTGGLLSIFSFLCRIVDFKLTSNLMLSELDRNYLRWVFMLFPGYALNSGVYEITIRKIARGSLFAVSATSAQVNDSQGSPSSLFGLFPGFGKNSCKECWNANTSDCCIRDPFDIDVALAPIAYGLMEAVVFTILVFAAEKKTANWQNVKLQASRNSMRITGDNDQQEDEDVQAERQRVQRLPTFNDNVFVRHLRKQYGRDAGSKVALHDLCLAIPRGECFGYLGINGAGKSTTMNILTGQTAPSHGFASLGGFALSTHLDEARRQIGYCPQFDSLHDLLTVEEQLELYAALRGIPTRKIQMAVTQKIQEVGLQAYAAKLTRGLSGGNKRKCSTAIALMGSPRVIFLDEPSTGVDPSSRRRMWDVIANVCAEKSSSVVLTTHSMEECEALCSRVGILVSGRLRCLGSVGHLKSKYGQGYTVEINLKEPEVEDPQVVQIQEQVTHFLGYGHTSITSQNVVSLCGSLGIESRGRMILQGEGNGWLLSHYLECHDVIPLNTFCLWWESSNRSDTLCQFFQTNFPNSKLVEHQGDHFRFHVPKFQLRPFVVFKVLENAKHQLFVSEYSVSDTTLEHIFNSMAAQQDEETLVANGLYDTPLGVSSVQSVRSYHRSSFRGHSERLRRRSSTLPQATF